MHLKFNPKWCQIQPTNQTSTYYWIIVEISVSSVRTRIFFWPPCSAYCGSTPVGSCCQNDHHRSFSLSLSVSLPFSLSGPSFVGTPSSTNRPNVNKYKIKWKKDTRRVGVAAGVDFPAHCHLRIGSEEAVGSRTLFFCFLIFSTTTTTYDTDPSFLIIFYYSPPKPRRVWPLAESSSIFTLFFIAVVASTTIRRGSKVLYIFF